jgi:hypothetical protein
MIMAWPSERCHGRAHAYDRFSTQKTPAADSSIQRQQRRRGWMIFMVRRRAPYYCVFHASWQSPLAVITKKKEWLKNTLHLAEYSLK